MYTTLLILVLSKFYIVDSMSVRQLLGDTRDVYLTKEIPYNYFHSEGTRITNKRLTKSIRVALPTKRSMERQEIKMDKSHWASPKFTHDCVDVYTDEIFGQHACPDRPECTDITSYELDSNWMNDKLIMCRGRAKRRNHVSVNSPGIFSIYIVDWQHHVKAGVSLKQTRVSNYVDVRFDPTDSYTSIILPFEFVKAPSLWSGMSNIKTDDEWHHVEFVLYEYPVLLTHLKRGTEVVPMVFELLWKPSEGIVHDYFYYTCTGFNATSPHINSFVDYDCKEFMPYNGTHAICADIFHDKRKRCPIDFYPFPNSYLLALSRPINNVVKPWYTNIVDEIMALVRDAFVSLNESIDSTIGSFADKIEKAFVRFFTETIPNAFLAVWRKIPETVAAWWDDLVSSAGDIEDFLLKILGTILRVFGKLFNVLLAQMVEFLESPAFHSALREFLQFSFAVMAALDSRIMFFEFLIIFILLSFRLRTTPSVVICFVLLIFTGGDRFYPSVFNWIIQNVNISDIVEGMRNVTVHSEL